MNRYKIMLLGPSGCGKTVYLASLFNQLWAIGKHRRYYLRPGSDAQGARLNTIYDQAANPKIASWPLGTLLSDILEWKFTCVVRVPELTPSDINVLDFTFFDYAGEHLEFSYNDDSESQFQKQLRSVNCLIGMFDGKDILKLMQGDLTDQELAKRYHNAFRILLQSQTSPRPLYIILTKWDLISPHYSWEQVRQRLLQNRELIHRILVNQEMAHQLVRLIPVTSTGFDFARWENNEMRKNPHGHMNPTYIEFPLACVVIDWLKGYLLYLESHKDTLPKEQQIDLQSLKQHASLFTFSINMSLLIPQLLISLLNPKIGDFVGMARSEIVKLSQRYQNAKQQRDASFQALTQKVRQIQADQHLITDYVIAEFNEQVTRLDCSFPRNILSSDDSKN